ncbi:MAG: dihydroneopterin aldolase [Syntrophomonas sp.]|uniref:dihydroneopterin aldolase n=1 Tax=Syntrophomonas sp. TaxID=2053627 RepID=UPI002620869D|nr:dihydroneopterin aldolase [Syntrophomonas sp.]MDD2510449.1 dihydroneopterin aldolase [Syntrophomonas sp.]MDD3879744.1 dihydroneopterin aldolase [Syntrophomonas sp.]MDD4626705.1 dihydroneopterin aldolase [Syntrophomonas sp.]
MDKIIARGLEFQACHGLLPAEKETPQKFLVDLDLFLNLRAAAESDDLALTVDYDKVFHLVENIVEKQSYNLLETLAEKIAATLLDSFAALQAVEVQVSKPDAPVKGNFDYIAVKIRREK